MIFMVNILLIIPSITCMLWTRILVKLIHLPVLTIFLICYGHIWNFQNQLVASQENASRLTTHVRSAHFLCTELLGNITFYSSQLSIARVKGDDENIYLLVFCSTNRRILSLNFEFTRRFLEYLSLVYSYNSPERRRQHD